MTIHTRAVVPQKSVPPRVVTGFFLANMALVCLLVSAYGGGVSPAALASAASPATAPRASAVAAPKPTVRLITYENVAEGYDKILARFPLSRLPGESDWRSGHQKFVLLVDSPGHAMLDQPTAIISSRHDNLGSKLSRNPIAGRRDFFLPESNLSLDHRHAFVVLYFNDAASRGATSVVLEGRLEVHCAASSKPVVVKNVPFRVGSVFEVGDTSFSLDTIETPYQETNFTFTANKNPQDISVLRFLDAKTNKPFATFLNVDPQTIGKYEMLGKTSQPPGAMNIEAELAQGEENVTIPFKFVASVGDPTGATLRGGAATPGKVVAAMQQPASAPAASPQVTINAIGFRRDVPIGQKVASEWSGFWGSFEHFRRPATKLWLHVAADRPILKSSTALYSSSHFTDDLGTVLHGFETEKKPADSAPQVKGLSKDGRETTIGVFSNDLPAADAKYLLFKGAITLLLAAPPVTTETKGISMTVGTQFKIGARECIITNVSFSPETGHMTMYVTIPGSIDGVSNLTFLDDDGKVLDDITPAKQFRPEFTKSSFLHVAFPRLVETATVRATARPDGQTVTVPINVKVPIGL